MKVSAERLPASQVRLEITSDQEEFDQAVERATRRVAQQVMVPGFRRGKAPRALVVRHVGRATIVNEANGDLMDDLYRRALEQEELYPVARPEVEVLESEPLAFRVAVEISPSIDIEGYDTVRVEPEHFSVSDADVDAYIDQLREERSPWVDPPTARPVREGDQVVVDIAAFEGDQPFDESTTGATFTLGRDNLLPQIRDLILGATVGEPVERTVVFPDANPETEPEPPVVAEGEGTVETAIEDGQSLDTDDGGDASETDETERSIPEQLLGKTLDYRVTVQSIKERASLPLDDELATALGSPRPQSLTALRADIYRQLHRQRELQARVTMINRIMDQLRGVAKVEIGPALLQQQTEEDAARQLQQIGGGGIDIRQLFGNNPEVLQGFLDRVRPESEIRLTNSLIARAIAEQEGVEVTEDDIHAEVHRLGMSHEVLEDERSVALIEADLRERAIFDRLIALATDGAGLVDKSPESQYAAAAPEPTPHDHDAHDHDAEEEDDLGSAEDTDATAPHASGETTAPDAAAAPTPAPVGGEAESLDEAEAKAEDPATEIAYRSGEAVSVADTADAGTMEPTSEAASVPPRDENPSAV